MPDIALLKRFSAASITKRVTIVASNSFCLALSAPVTLLSSYEKNFYGHNIWLKLDKCYEI
ncbi:hypothetical protein GCM10023151_04670 [Kangiella marina]|uniref:Uncharacterized protein n=1 Tax=Kangiella marina TaxID=1079178 RepID=A0ABP8IE35_9GAMM